MTPSERSVAEGILFTDHYQLTMAQLYFDRGLHERSAQFDYFFRRYPDYGVHQAGYCVMAGSAWLMDWMSVARFGSDALDFLASLEDGAGGRVFRDDFLSWLGGQGFEDLDIDAVPEGRVIHPHTPLAVVRGPLAMVQILESSLLNHLNYQTLIATKASRIHEAGRRRPVLEFGLRRAQGRGASAGARAALIGGAGFTSNVGMSRVMGLSPKGTHAHSMVQAFMALGEGELGAFRAYADAYPDDCLLLVDTIDTLGSGVPNAIRVFESLRDRGHAPVGIRLDSGDLAHLAVQSARMLDDAGFRDTQIVLSNELDELNLMQIVQQIDAEAPRYGLSAESVIQRLVYGVGTRLITSKGQGALGGVYKLVGIQDADDTWQPAIKVSESPAKTPNPGAKHVWRLYDRRGMAVVDMLTLDDGTPLDRGALRLRHPTDHTKHRALDASALTRAERLLEPLMRDGREVDDRPSLDVIRERRSADLRRLDPGVQRLVNPHRYHVSLDDGLWSLKEQLIREAKAGAAPVEPDRRRV